MPVSAAPSFHDLASGGPFAGAGASFAAALDALPPGWLAAFVVVLGLVVGSFLNVVIHRLPIMLERAWQADLSDATGHPAPDDGLPARYNLWLPRSACPHCGHVLRAWENLPLAGWLLLRGRCSHCGARISARYPLTELACALCAAGMLALFGPTGKALAGFVLCATLIAASAIDIEHQLLPDTLTLPLVWAGLAVNLGDTFVSLPDAVLGAMAGYLSLWSVYWLFRLVRGVEGIGYGDFKLLAALGAWFGWAALPQIVAIAAIAGAAVGLAATLTGRMHFREPLPFGPWLALGGLVTLVAGLPLYTLFGG